MKRSIYSPPEAFSLSPLLVLLPVKGRIGRLESLSSSLYARYEKVATLQKEVGPEHGRDAQRRVNAEAAMLKQVLDWLAIKPESGKV